VRSGIELGLVADRICQSMLHHGVGDSPAVPGAAKIPALRCRLVLEGLAARPPSAASLERSAPLRAARAVSQTWSRADDTDRAAHLCAVARTAFGRRGFATTTMRDIAAEAGLSIGSVYRSYRSKEDLLVAVMAGYGDARREGWEAVVAARSPSVVATLDALAYLNIELIAHYGDEFRIQLGLLRERPGVLRRLGSTDAQRRILKQLLVAGEAAGEVRLAHGSADLYARCLYEAVFTPESVVQAAGVEGAHALARETILAGALVRAPARTPARSARAAERSRG
jgi:AcrR family transcriptional regulator